MTIVVCVGIWTTPSRLRSVSSVVPHALGSTLPSTTPMKPVSPQLRIPLCEKLTTGRIYEITYREIPDRLLSLSSSPIRLPSPEFITFITDRLSIRSGQSRLLMSGIKIRPLYYWSRWILRCVPIPSILHCRTIEVFGGKC